MHGTECKILLFLRENEGSNCCPYFDLVNFVLQLTKGKNLLSHSQNEVLKEFREITQIWWFVLEGVLFGGCVVWVFLKKQDCKPNSTERTESLPPALLAVISVYLPQALSDVKVSTCISGAGFFLYTSLPVIHRRLYIVHGIKSRVCTPRKSSFDGKKPIWVKIYWSRKNPHSKQTHTFLP